MGISRDSVHKRRATGGRQKRIRMKRKFEMGRQPAATKIGEKKVNPVRVRGGHFKFRALRLDTGNFTWPGEAVTRKTRILKVAYNSTNNELVRTNTLVKGSIVLIDSAPFKAWYSQHYNFDLSGKKKLAEEVPAKKGDKVADKKEAAKKDDKKVAVKAGGKKADDKGSKKGDKKVEEKKGGDKKAVEKKGGDKKAVEKKGGDKKAVEKKGGDKKAVEKKGGDKKAADKKPADKKADDKKGDKKVAEKKGADNKKAPEKKDTKPAGKERVEKKKEEAPVERSARVLKKIEKRNKTRVLEDSLAEQFKVGKVYAKLTSRPGQCGRADGYILEGEELAFYLKKINMKKKK